MCFLAIAVVVAAVAGVCAPARAAEERPVLAVVPINGPPGAKQAEVIIMRTLRKKETLVPQTTWTKAARKLVALSDMAEDSAVVAADVGAQVVITGIMRRVGRRWELTVCLR